MWYYLGAVVALVIGHILWQAIRGLRQPIETLRDPIEQLLRRGYNSGVLRINVPFSRKFVRLRKYIRAPGVFGVELVYPRSKWSSRYIDSVQRYCVENRIRHDVFAGNQANPPELLVADFGGDLDLAYECVSHILLGVFAAKRRRGCLVCLNNAAVGDTLVDR